METPLRALVIGASGYSGAEILRLLSRRQDVTVSAAVAASNAGTRVDALYPELAGRVNLSYQPLSGAARENADVVFLALPSGEAMGLVPGLLDRVGRVIDLGGDYRLPEASLYEEFYRRHHSSPSLLQTAVYGLPELHREKIREARLVANPGCYPTGAILALLPALTGGLIRADHIVINALSGASGAGRSASVELSFSEVNENVRSYRVGTHQHIPEIRSVLEQASGCAVSFSFVPHLLPVTRGIYTTIHADLARPVSIEECYARYEEYYRSAPFVRVRREVPELRGVVRTNYCDIGLAIEPRTGQLIIMSAIDNLVKGAAGQAVQNMNIMFGRPEETSLA